MTVTWRDRVANNPFGAVAAVAGILLGGLGALLGDSVSLGMSNSLQGSADVVAHLWGLAFASGGLLKLAGLVAGRTTLEIPGLWMLGGGFLFYSITVTVGLGHSGVAAGIVSGSLAVGCFLKTRLIMRRARVVAGGGVV